MASPVRYFVMYSTNCCYKVEILTIWYSLIRDVLGQKKVLGDYVVDFSLNGFAELDISHVDINNIGVALESILQSAGIGIVNEVTGNVKSSDGAVQLKEL